jgi:S-(hydroxymethyl)glutathione dehydrogenase / alcohol dehydrogenase
MASHASKVSRRNMLKKAAAVGGGAAATLLGGGVQAQAPAIQTGTQAGRRYRAYVVFDNPANTTLATARASVEQVTMSALDENRVVVRTEACQVCYTIVGQAVANYNPARILGHGAVGVVEVIGSKVRRVQPGDRVIVANTPYCGQCYSCLRGRPDRCQMLPGAGNPMLPIGKLSTGADVVQHNNEGGFAELMIPYEWYCMPVFTSRATPVELSMLGCVGACGLGTTFGIAPVEPASDVVVLGCGPVGLSAVQGARIKGASQIIAIDPIRARREVALSLGATLALDPNAEGMNLVAKVKDLCKFPTDRKFAGGRDWAAAGNNIGPDYVIEAVGGDAFPPKAEVGPDPTGILPLQQAWQMCSSAGHVTTVSVGQRGNFTLPAGQWSNGAKNHHPGNMNGVSTLRDMQRFARLVDTGQFNAKALATAIFPLDRAKDAVQVVADRTTVSAVITFA